MYQPKQSSSRSRSRAFRALALASMVTLSVVAPVQATGRTELAWQFSPTPAAVAATPPLPSPAQFPVQLVVDDDSPEGTVGVAGAAARQFLWFNRFTPGGAFDLEETWVLFPSGDNMVAGAAVQIAIYQDADGNPANGATLLATFDETIQAVDGGTFSVYSTPVSFDGVGDLLIGVVPRFIVSGVTTATGPAAIDTGASQGRSWLAIWSTDPPNPPALTPPPDVSIALVDGTLPGNWLIRGFGTPPPAVAVPTLGEAGLVLLSLALALAAAFVLRRRGRIAAALLLGMATAGAAEAQVTIDTFATNQGTISVPPGGSSTATTAGSDILGLKRGLAPQLVTGAGPATVGVAGGNLTFAVTATTPDSRGQASITWDGDNNALVLSPSGLGAINLTTGGASGFRIRVASTSATKTELNFTVHSGAGNSSRAARLLPLIASSTDVFIPFSEFRVAAGSGANFSSVGAIELIVRATEATVVIDEIVTASPVVAATKVDAQIVDIDNDTRVDPGDRLRYTITVTNTGSEALNVNLADTIDANTTLVTGSVSATPIARNDQYVAVGNVALNVNGSSGKPGLLANDSDPDGDTVTVQAGTFPATTTQGGSLSLVNAATGTFTYSPPVGFKGVDSFTYSIVDDNANVAMATATIALDQVVWFVDDAHPGGNLGTLADPFVGILPGNVGGAGGAGDVDSPGDILFIFEGNHNGIELEPDQWLIGEGEGLLLNGDVIVPAGVPPIHANAAGPGILLSTNNRIRGVNVGNTSAAGISGTNFSTVDIANTSVTGTGPVLSLTNGALAAAFSGLATTSSASTAITLSNVTGTLSTAGSTSLAGVTGTGILVNGGTATLGFGTTTVGATAGGVDLAGTTAAAGFSSLAVTTSAGFGVRADSGTINLAGSSNTVVATGGPALDLVSMSLGSGATFSTVSSTNSPGKGLNLDTVTGSFVATGGSISNAGGISFDLNAGSSTVTYGGSISNIANVFLVEITGRTGGTATLSGNLSSTSNGNGLRVASNTSGTIVFSGSTKTLNTGSDAAVTLSTNGGATINFTGGGLDIDTTSGIGFNATGGAAAITVQGGGNSIASTTGTALNVASTTIGSSGLTFQSIASNGAPSGIVLNATGSSGGLTVTGTGSAGSGGTIQSSTGPGISLTSASNTSLSFLNVQSGSDDGINAAAVAGLSLNGVQVLNNGNSTTDEGIELINPAGTIAMTNVIATGNAHNNLSVDDADNVGGNSVLSISGSSFSSNSAANGNHGGLVQIRGTAVLGVSSITGSTFSNNKSIGLQVTSGDSATISDLTVSSSTFQDTGTGNSQEIAMDFSKGQTSNMTVKVLNNTGITGHNSHGMNFFTAAGAGTTGIYNARISGNTIGNSAIAGSGSLIGNCIRININGDADATVLVDNNILRQCPNGRGIEAIARNGVGGLDLTVTNNDINPQDTSGFPLAAIIAQSNTSTIANTLRSDIRGNTVPAGTAFDLLPTFIAVVETSTSVSQLVDSPPASADCTAQLTSTNTGSASASPGCALIAGPISTPP